MHCDEEQSDCDVERDMDCDEELEHDEEGDYNEQQHENSERDYANVEVLYDYNSVQKLCCV